MAKRLKDMGLSPAYYAGIEEGRRHHLSNKTYSGSLLRPHKPFLTEMVKRLECESACDIGAGKGRQWEWIDPEDGMTIEQVWGFDVFKYDPCWPPFEEEPRDRFDLVICTHTLSLIPVADIDSFLHWIYDLALGAVFIAEKIGERKKDEVSDPNGRAINWTAVQWVEKISFFGRFYPSIETVLSVRTKEPRGKITTRHLWRHGSYLGWFEASPRE